MPPRGTESDAPGGPSAWWSRWIDVDSSQGGRTGSTEDSLRPFTWWFLGALLVAVAARFVRLNTDPPYGIVSSGGEFLSDEGWYTQSAQLRAKFGEWTNRYDPVWFSGTALFAFIQSVAFRVAGVSLLVARTVSVASACVMFAAFYAMLRTIQPRAIALATCLVAAVTLHGFSFSRLAVVEPMGNAISMLALLAWVRLPRGVPACAAGLLLGTAAYFVKASFIFTLAVMVALALGEAVLLLRSRSRVRAAVVLASIAAVPFLVAAIQRCIDGVAPEQAAIFSEYHVAWRTHAVLAGDNPLVRECRYVLRAFFRLTYITGTLALGAVIVAGVAWMLVRTRLRPRLRCSRAGIALILWLVAGTTFFGLFDSQPIRYFGFAICPLAFVAVMMLREASPAVRWAPAALCLCLAHLATQVPGYAAWFSRVELATADSAARDAVSRMDLDGAPDGVGVIGDLSSFLSFYDPRIRPLTYRDTLWLDERVALWRPRYLFEFPSRVEKLRQACPGLVERVEPMASYRIMENFTKPKDPEDFALFRIVYAR